VKKVVKGKAKLDFAANVQTTLEDTVLRLADINERIKAFGNGTGKDLASAVGARFARGGEPEGTLEIAGPIFLPPSDLDMAQQQQQDSHELGKLILDEVDGIEIKVHDEMEVEEPSFHPVIAQDDTVELDGDSMEVEASRLDVCSDLEMREELKVNGT